MLPWAWDPQLWAEQMIHFGWRLMMMVGVAVGLLALVALVGMLERIKDQTTSKLEPHQEPLVHVLNRGQQKPADV